VVVVWCVQQHNRHGRKILCLPYCATLVKLREPSPEGYREALRLYRIIIMRGTLIRARRPHAAGDEMNLE